MADFEIVEFEWQSTEPYTVTLPDGEKREVQLGDVVLGYFPESGGIVVTGFKGATQH